MVATPESSPKRPNRLLVIGGIVLLLVVAAVVAFRVLIGVAPDEVSIDSATSQLEQDDQGADDESAEAQADGVEGTWAVDTSIGEFGFEDSTGSFVGFRVDEVFSDIGQVTAVGRVPDVAGTLEIGDGAVNAVTIEAQMGSLVTDDSKRDTKALGTLDVLNFPTATFVLGQPVELPDGADDGTAFTVEAAGDLTIHGVTKPLVIDLEAQLVDGVVAVVGSTDIVFADFDIKTPSVSPPQAPISITVEDEGILELQLFFSRG